MFWLHKQFCQSFESQFRGSGLGCLILRKNLSKFRVWSGSHSNKSMATLTRAKVMLGKLWRNPDAYPDLLCSVAHIDRKVMCDGNRLDREDIRFKPKLQTPCSEWRVCFRTGSREESKGLSL